MQCSEIMRRRLETVEPETTVAEAAELMRHAGCGILPVCLRDGTVVGVVTDRDIALRVCAERGSLEVVVGAIMSTDVVSCRPDDTVWRAEQLMMQAKKMRLIVTDERNRLAGIVSLTDIAQFEEPLRAAQVLRELSAREFRVESRGLSQPPPPSSRPSAPRSLSKPPARTRGPDLPERNASSR